MGFYEDFKQMVNKELRKDPDSLLQRHIKNHAKAKFNLLYQGSVDGFKCQAVHNKVDDKGSFVAFILSDSGRTFGAYTSVGYSAQFKARENQVFGYPYADSEAFLFSLSHRTYHPQVQK